MQRAGRDVEKTVLSRALDLVLNDRVFINGNQNGHILMFNIVLIEPQNSTKYLEI